MPSYIDPHNPGDSFEAHYAEREPLYEAVGGHVIHTKEDKEDEVMKDLLDLIKKLQKKGIH